jgi:phospholipid transport system substrate-binding protein
MIRTGAIFNAIATIAIALVLVGVSPARAINAGEPSQFIQDLGNTAVGMVTNNNLTQADKAQQFRQLLRDGFALPSIARFAMGRYWRKADETQRERYTHLFEDYIVASYSARFNEYEGEAFKIVEEKRLDEGAAIVTTSIQRPNAKPVQVDWQVRDHNGQLKIVDVVIEGISMTLTQRSDFAAAIRQAGGDIDKFLDSLANKANNGAK